MKRARCWCCWLILPLLLSFLIFLAVYFLEAGWRLVHDMFFDQLGTQNFAIEVPVDDPTVNICVRDYGCEDGDRVRVYLNSQQVFSGEIYKEKTCVSAKVNAGNNTIKMYAINGTGGKGNCPNNINTGEVDIGNLNWQSQSWSLEPDTDRSATLQVNVRQ